MPLNKGVFRKAVLLTIVKDIQLHYKVVKTCVLEYISKNYSMHYLSVVVAVIVVCVCVCGGGLWGGVGVCVCVCVF